jgi:hypothetical protein
MSIGEHTITIRRARPEEAAAPCSPSHPRRSRASGSTALKPTERWPASATSSRSAPLKLILKTSSSSRPSLALGWASACGALPWRSLPNRARVPSSSALIRMPAPSTSTWAPSWSAKTIPPPSLVASPPHALRPTATSTQMTRLVPGKLGKGTSSPTSTLQVRILRVLCGSLSALVSNGLPCDE